MSGTVLPGSNNTILQEHSTALEKWCLKDIVLVCLLQKKWQTLNVKVQTNTYRHK